VILQYIQAGYIDVPMIIATIVILLFGMGLHEYGHNAMAAWWGDPTPRERGRLTINPFVHIFWPGFFMWLFLGFGPLGFAAVNSHRMRDPRWGTFWMAFAGPLMNLLLAIVSAIILRIAYGPLIDIYVQNPSSTTAEIVLFIVRFLSLSVTINVLVFIFNLLPFFPLDGWRMVFALLPASYMHRNQVPVAIRTNARPISEFLQRPAVKWEVWAPVTQFILIGLVVISLFGRRFGLPFDPLSMLISQPADTITNILIGGVF
jgi:Zn-dependent protease